METEAKKNPDGWSSSRVPAHRYVMGEGILTEESKQWLDDAVIGLQSEGPSKSASWPKDVPSGNVVIHAIDTVLVPGAFQGSR